ncbi:MAG: glycerophosphodiester phosphodiesterase [Treponema sp.]|nr:glycerophosphodiester phosphodiesterase [Treponema sp.]
MSRRPLLPDRSRPLIFAHRGCSSLAPENTMGAFKKARDLGAGGLELDVHICASPGILVVAHDDTFKRTAGDGRNVEDLSWGEIRRINVGAYFQDGKNAGTPPRLEEVLEEFCPGMYVDIELKTRKIRGDPLPMLAAKIIRALGNRTAGAVTVSSFNPFSLAAFRTRCPGVPTAAIWSAGPEVPPFLRRGLGRFIAHCDYVKPVYRQLRRPLRPAWTAWEGRPAVPWTIDDPGLAEKMLRLGCEGIITNRPQDMRFGTGAHDR